MSHQPPPTPPHPELVRQPRGAFGWLHAELLNDGWLADLGPNATALLVLLALAADRRGASFYGRDRMAAALGITRHDIDQALQRLMQMRLVAHRPWRPGSVDGVWQLLPIPTRCRHRRHDGTLSVAELLRGLGLVPGTETAE